jgi:type II secretory pathway pseudopilin PulG
VVAIIAILAAIAVPNFLEAQTRAKVSRVKNDLRALATAEEAYYVDFNSYTKYDRGDSWLTLEGWKQLTTPVAYITSIPKDPFGISRTNPNTANSSPAWYELGTGDPGAGPGAPQPDGQADRPMTRATHSWTMSGNGPDHLDQTDGGSQWDNNQFNWAEWNYPWVQFADNPNAALELVGLFYDPTNGTVSRGDIFRVGGQKPAGVVFDRLYSLAPAQ